MVNIFTAIFPVYLTNIWFHSFVALSAKPQNKNRDKNTILSYDYT
jgi:hypothetical protein